MATLPSLNGALAAAAILFALFVQGTLGGITCEQLKKEECAFAVSSSGRRCVLEKYVRRGGQESYKCTTSDIEADKLKDMIESNQCIQACGLDRDTLGISSDSLLESHFTQKLCSPQCYQKCPNIVDLYFNLAAGEGVFLPKLCATQGENPRRGMAEIKSSGIVAPGPINPTGLSGAPASAPLSPVEFSGSPASAPLSPVEFSGSPASSPH